jgi:hypothetical protein
MKIYELVETMISPVGPGEMPTGSNPTQPSVKPSTTNQPGTVNTGTNTTGTPMGQQPQDISNIKNNLNNLKDLLRAAGASGTIDTAKIAQALGDPKQAMNPNTMQAVAKQLIPGIADALQNNQAAGQIKAGIKTGITAQQQAQQNNPK